MALDYDSVSAHIRHTLGGDISAELNVLDIINNAGDFMASMYPWRWLEEVVTFQGIHDQSYITLPVGFAELMSFAPRGLDSRADVNLGRFYAVSAQEIWDKREVSIDGSSAGAYTSVPKGAFYFAIAYNSAGGTVTPVPRMELFPTPDSSKTATVHTHTACVGNMTYRRSWTPITAATSTGSVFVCPQFMEPLYLQMVRAFTRGYEEEDVATTNARIGEVANGPLFMTAVQRDALIEATTLRTVRRSTPTALAGVGGGQQG